MAKNIKGITIEIGGDTTKLQKSINAVSAPINKINRELKDLNLALKLDPKNTELLAQKQEVLGRNIAATKDKLQALKDAQAKMGDYNKLTDEQKESYNRLSVEIAKSESSLKKMNQELKETNKVDLSKLKDGLKKAGDIALDVSKKMMKVTAAISGALAGLVTAGVKSYADLEQNLGGVETLFKDSADKVIKNAKEAYKTAGVSANEYMAGVTSFSASLLQSLGGNTAKAADVADMAFRDMSDNANKFGTDMASIQNAYQGFAKQNYTMLDNLKLGYGGTKTEMERLLKDAEKLSGVKYNISNLSDVYNAIHVIQEELGVTGTTAEEAEKTISGSVNSMKAAFDNFLNGSGSPQQLAETITNVFKNIGKAITELAPDILSGVVILIQELLPQVVAMISSMLPQLLDAVTNMIDKILEMLTTDTAKLSSTIGELVTKIVTFITENLPKILEAAIAILIALAKGISENLDTIIPALVECIITIVTTLIDHLPDIIDAGIELIIGLAIGLIQAIPKLVEKIPIIIGKIVSALLKPEMLAKIIEAALRLIIALGAGLIQAIPQLLLMLPRIIIAIANGLKDTIKNTNWGQLGKNILSGILNGFINMKQAITNAIKRFKNQFIGGIKSFFGIHSPSKVMEAEIGVNLGLGLVEGLEDTQKQVNDAMTQLSSGIVASVNPTINPTANSNPLIIQIENFNNTRESDIQKLAQELEFYRKNSAVAKGGS